ncbi:hypothetical protein MRX96_002812 [Rhipicephalus microplus]
MKGEAGTTSAGREAKRRASTSRLDFVGDGQDGGGRGGAAPVHAFCYAHAAGQLNQRAHNEQKVSSAFASGWRMVATGCVVRIRANLQKEAMRRQALAARGSGVERPRERVCAVIRGARMHV